MVVLLTGAVALVAACGGAATRPSPSPAATPTPPPASAYQALVLTLESPADVQSHYVYSLYDSSIGRARELIPGNGGLDGNLRFAPGSRVSVGNYAHIVSMDVTGGSARSEAVAPAASYSIGDYAWSRAGTLAYLLIGDPARAVVSQLVVRPASGPAVQVPFGPVPAGVNATVRFSPDGARLLIEAAGVQVRGLDGGLLLDASNGSAATWGPGGRLYYWDPRGINVADPATGQTTTILPGVRWYAPDATPDGKLIVYELRDAQGDAELRFLDTTTGRVDGRFGHVDGHDPRFVSNAVLWFHQQASKEPALAPLIGYDLLNQTERPVGMSGRVTDSRQMASA